MSFSNDSNVVAPFEGRKFSEIFEVLGKSKGVESKVFRIETKEKNEFSHSPRYFVHKFSVAGWMYFTLTDGYKNETGENWLDSINLNVSGEILTWISNNMLSVDHDQISFKGIVFQNGRVDVYACYGQIIGSRLIGRFSLCEIMGVAGDPPIECDE